MNNTLIYLAAIFVFVYTSQLIAPIPAPIKWVIAALGLILVIVAMVYGGFIHVLIR